MVAGWSIARVMHECVISGRYKAHDLPLAQFTFRFCVSAESALEPVVNSSQGYSKSSEAGE